MKLYIKREFKKFIRKLLEAEKNESICTVAVSSILGHIFLSVPAKDDVTEKLSSTSESLKNAAHNLPYFFCVIINGNNHSNMFCQAQCHYYSLLMNKIGKTIMTLVIRNGQLYLVNSDASVTNERFSIDDYMNFCLYCFLSVDDKSFYSNHKYTDL